jgi:hypothetical protein
MFEARTMSEMIEAAQRDGYTHSFKAEVGGLRVLETDEMLQPNQVTILRHERFEGPSSEDDEEALYYMETTTGLRGTLVDAYGTYADEHVANFIRKVDTD